MIAAKTLAAILIAAMPAVSIAIAPMVATDKGIVAGTVEGNVSAFRGIPFAQPPVADLRWRAPQPAAAWAGVRQAIQFAPACMQAPPPGAAGIKAPPRSEDCLYLNVWKPAGATQSSRLPVMVWIHGGAFRAGATSDPRIDGDLLAAKGIIVVSVAYRLGVLGFLSHPALSAESAQHRSGNYGLLDQIAALQWVKRNIAAFGGDPAKVTIGGLSAGAISTTMLAAAPDARGLFRGIISMSGGSFAPLRSPAEGGENVEPLARAEQNGVAFGKSLGATDAQALRALPAEQLVSADGRGVSWPIADGAIIQGDEYLAFDHHTIANVPLLLGTTANEGYSFSQIHTLAEYRAEVTRRYGSFAGEIFAAYPATNDAEAATAARNLLRDVMFGWGTWVWADQAARHGQKAVYAYYWAHSPPPGPGVRPDAGPAHGSDQPYPFGIAHQDRAWTEADRTISNDMLGYFANFIRTGDPNGAGLPDWPAFTVAGQQVLRFGEEAPVAATVANTGTIGVIDRYMALRRRQNTLGAPR